MELPPRAARPHAPAMDPAPSRGRASTATGPTPPSLTQGLTRSAVASGRSQAGCTSATAASASGPTAGGTTPRNGRARGAGDGDGDGVSGASRRRPRRGARSTARAETDAHDATSASSLDRPAGPRVPPTSVTERGSPAPVTRSLSPRAAQADDPRAPPRISGGASPSAGRRRGGG